MNFYNAIAKYYEDIFPLGKDKLNFTLSELSTNTNSILDIGCATGSLCLNLPLKKQISGIDLDDKMIEIAKDRAFKLKQNINFQVMDMLTINEHFSTNCFDVMFCFGNTIVHLQTPDKIELFLKHVKHCLKPNGKFLVQLVNYDRILANKITSLPLIDNKSIKFERNYNYPSNSKLIKFTTQLLIKETSLILSNSIELYPLTHSEFSSLAKNAGFSSIEFYGSFKKDTYKPKSSPGIIAVCQ
jgi:glycine/sarcosine N-methyltransferase